MASKKKTGRKIGSSRKKAVPHVPKLSIGLWMEAPLAARDVPTEVSCAFKAAARAHIGDVIELDPAALGILWPFEDPWWESDHEKDLRGLITQAIADSEPTRQIRLVAGTGPSGAYCVPTKEGWIKTRVYDLEIEQVRRRARSPVRFDRWKAAHFVDQIPWPAQMQPSSGTLRRLKTLRICACFELYAPDAE